MQRLIYAPKLAFLAIILVAATTGCVTSMESDVDVTPAPHEDRAYYDVLLKSTQSRSVFKDFEARYNITATFLSPEFRTAFAKRLERVYKHTDVHFEEAQNKAGFFISLHSPDDDRTDLSNPQHWTVQLDVGQGPLKPILIKRLVDKERWRAFFDRIDEWTTEYLVVFDTPPVTPNSPDLVAKTTARITFANADAQVKLTW